MSILSDERGSAYPYLIFWIVIPIVAIIWIVANEVIINVGALVGTSLTADDGGTWAILVSMFRATPIVILLCTLIWAIVSSHRGEAV